MLSSGVRGDEEDEIESKSKYESTSMVKVFKDRKL